MARSRCTLPGYTTGMVPGQACTLPGYIPPDLDLLVSVSRVCCRAVLEEALPPWEGRTGPSYTRLRLVLFVAVLGPASTPSRLDPILIQNINQG